MISNRTTSGGTVPRIHRPVRLTLAAALLSEALAPAAALAQVVPEPGRTMDVPSLSTAAAVPLAPLPIPPGYLIPEPGAAPAAPAAAPAEPPSDSASRRAVSIRGGMSALVESISMEPTDFDFKESDLLGILRTFAAKFNRNIIAGPGVGGRVTLRLRGVPFDEAFRIMLENLGLVAIQKTRGVIEIVKASDMPFLVEAFPLKYRFAQEVKTTLESMLRGLERERTIITVDTPSNAIIITSTNDTLHKMKTTLDQLDVPTPQIAIKARLIEVQAGNLLNWGLAWSSQSRARGSTIRSIDNMKNFTVAGTGEVATTNAVTQFPDGLILDVMTIMDKTKLYALINMIQTDTKTKTISEPSILTGNNKTAKIHVGQNLPVRTSQTTQTATTQSIQYIPEGVDLDVTPIVAPGSNMISFQIRVGVSELVGFQDNNPITTERVAQTAVTVESGKTVVIGGLIKEKTTDTDSGVPFLKNIPLLGWLFKSKRKTKDKTELLIFITPELVVDSR
jgi:type IV pilus assembly protein PilQ